jgi:hypothetical protein
MVYHNARISLLWMMIDDDEKGLSCWLVFDILARAGYLPQILPSIARASWKPHEERRVVVIDSRQ